FGSGIMSLINSYWSRVRLLGYALLMLLTGVLSIHYSQLILREIFYILSDFSNILLDRAVLVPTVIGGDLAFFPEVK
ncbi:hypothetical protein, partial [Sphaerospermopsis reniformis]|uniref:hypothetical protein n=1 Tax=Sphaerospermopsis reniformis TaxID=531300 RepID=UPI001F3FCB31